MDNKFCECPQCGRPFERISASGKVGFCAYHKTWFACDDNAQSEANELNKKYEEGQKQEKLEKEKQEQIRKDAVKKKKRRSRAVKITTVLLLLLTIVAATFWFWILPKQEYNDAMQLMKRGKYGEALEQFSEISYGDSESNVVLCEAFLALESNDISSALKKVNQVGQSGNDLYEQLKTLIVAAISDWKAREIEPEELLSLLPEAEIFDQEGLLDTDALSIEAHVHMVDEDALDWYVEDVNGDGEQDLVILEPEQVVSVYQLNLETNVKVVLNENMISECLIRFGDRIFERDDVEALLLYQAAYEASPTVEHAMKVGNTYQKRAEKEKDERDYEAALADAEYAYDLVGDDEAFRFLYDIELQKCFAEEIKAYGLQEWETFLDNYSQAIEKHGLLEDHKTKTAELHLEYAMDLASKKDPHCVEQFREVYDRDINIWEVLTDEIESLDLCRTRIELRRFAIEISGNEVKKQSEQEQKLEDDLVNVLQEWGLLKIDAQDIFVLLKYADEMGIDNIDTKNIYHEAALEVASHEGELSDSKFIDWNQDGIEELLVISEEGTLGVYALEDKFKQVWNAQTDIEGPAVELIDNGFLIEAADGDSFVSYSYGDGKIQESVTMKELVNYKRDGKKISFGKILSGSIERSICYEYDLASLFDPPKAVEVDWQQEQYPYPETPEETTQRFFEAKGYQIEAEAELLRAEEVYEKLGFTFEALHDMPEAPYTVEINSYDVEAEVVLQEVKYKTGEEERQIYAAVVYKNGWKIAGFSDTFAPGMEGQEMDMSIPVLSLNAAAVNKLKDSGDKHLYRMLIPESSCVQMLWKAGDKQGNRTAFYVSIYDANDLSEAMTAYELKLSPSKQMSNPLFLAAGVYYIQVEAKSYEDCEYQLLMQAQAEQYVEQEENDSYESANKIEVNQEYMASLFRKDDIDCFVFALDSPGIIDVVLQADDIDSKKSRYELKLFNVMDGKLLSQNQMMGNVKIASMGKVYLGAGQYIVQISQGKTWSSWGYKLTVQYQESETIEQESNDTSETATPIPINTIINGSFGIEGDVDYYSFTLNSDMVIQPKLTFSPLESSSKTYVLTVSGEAGDLFAVNVGGKESGKVIAPLALKAGTYTVKLENPKFVQQDYSLAIAAMEADLTEAEPNNTLAFATELSVGQIITGVLSTQDDIDWYKISLSEEVTVALTFQFEQVTNSKTVFALQLEQNGKSQWSVNVKGESGGIEQKLRIPAGEYYLRVKAGNWIGTVYTLGLANAVE